MQAASGAVSGNNNDNNQGAFPPQQPVLYGHTGHAYDPTAAPLAQVGGDGKPQMGYYPPQAPPPPQQGGKSCISWLLAGDWGEGGSSVAKLGGLH